MFSQVQHVQESGEQSHAIIDCFDVRYIVYFDVFESSSNINSYIVHLNGNGLVRRDECPLHNRLFFGGPSTEIYRKAK